jgi:hypothetical protein
LKIPEKIVVFAFLKCRDIFWRYRYETITTIWSAVYERFSKEARCMSKSFEQFLQAYNKVKKAFKNSIPILQKKFFLLDY